MDRFDALGAAIAEFERRLRLVRSTDWSRATPCSEWDTHALVNHVIGGNVRYRMLLHQARLLRQLRRRPIPSGGGHA